MCYSEKTTVCCYYIKLRIHINRSTLLQLLHICTYIIYRLNTTLLAAEDWAPTPTREDNQPNRNMMVDDTEGSESSDLSTLIWPFFLLLTIVVAKDVHLPTAKCVGRITLDIEDWRPEVLTVCPSSPDTDSP